jgi:hypothetical protein
MLLGVSDVRVVPISEMVLDTSALPTFQIGNQAIWIGINFTGQIPDEGVPGIVGSSLLGLPTIQAIGSTYSDGAIPAGFNVTITAVPEPTIAVFLGFGSLGVFSCAKRQRKSLRLV